MHLLVAPLELKGTLTATQAAQALGEGLLLAGRGDEVELLPLADGGPGTLEVLLSAAGGRRVEVLVQGPLGRPVTAQLGLLPDGTAVVEMAQASGLWLLERGERDAMATSTFGTGQLIRAALDQRATRILVAVGGSATNDGGAGALVALGARLVDREGHPLPPGGAALARLEAVDLAGLDLRLWEVPLEVATDVVNPLLGATGATWVYGRQKGGSPEELALLDAALARYAERLCAATGRKVAGEPGAGAAGGLGFGLAAGLGARLGPGFERVAKAVELDLRLQRADHVLTAEGRLDAQTGFGKGPAALARHAGAHQVAVTCFAGRIEEGADLSAFAEAMALSQERVPTPDEARALLQQAAQSWRLRVAARGARGQAGGLTPQSKQR